MCKKSSKETTRQQQTVQQKLPPYIEDRVKQFLGESDFINTNLIPSEDGGVAPDTRVQPFSQDTLDMFDIVRGLPGESGLTPEDIGAGTFEDLAGFQPTQIEGGTVGGFGSAEASAVGDVADIAPGSSLDFLSEFQNPFTEDVVDAALADIQNQTDKGMAALGAKFAKAGAFGGSRQGVAEGQLLADAARAAGRVGADIRSRGFETALRGAEGEAGRVQQAGLANQNTQLNRALVGARLGTEASMANLSANLQAALTQAGLDQRAGEAQAAENLAAAGIRLAGGGALGDARLGINTLDNSRLMQSLDLLGQTGAMQQEQGQRERDEPFNALQYKMALLGLAPFPTTTASSSSGSRTLTQTPSPLSLGLAFLGAA